MVDLTRLTLEYSHLLSPGLQFARLLMMQLKHTFPAHREFSLLGIAVSGQLSLCIN